MQSARCCAALPSQGFASLAALRPALQLARQLEALLSDPSLGGPAAMFPEFCTVSQTGLTAACIPLGSCMVGIKYHTKQLLAEQALNSLLSSLLVLSSSPDLDIRRPQSQPARRGALCGGPAAAASRWYCRWYCCTVLSTAALAYRCRQQLLPLPLLAGVAHGSSPASPHPCCAAAAGCRPAGAVCDAAAEHGARLQGEVPGLHHAPGALRCAVLRCTGGAMPVARHSAAVPPDRAAALRPCHARACS